MATMGTLTITESNSSSVGHTGDGIEDSSAAHRRKYDSSLELFSLLGKSLRTSLESAGAGHFSLSRVAASILHRPQMNPRRSLSPSRITTATITITHSLLGSVPKEVLVRDILGFLTDKAVKVFLDSLGEERLKASSCSELRRQFCTTHGSRLEDPETFCGNSDSGELLVSDTKTKRSCPECHAEKQNKKRCNGCKVFYPRFRDHSNNDDNKAFPGLWCQQCDRMAFCNVCISNEEDGCGSEVAAPYDFAYAAFGAFGRKRLPSSTRRKYCPSGRITCHNYCCPNVFTNTMCGEFICDDCGDERQRLLTTDPHSIDGGSSDQQHDPAAIGIEMCDECGKATCLDPNCLVCADFKLIHMSCRFVPEDAYKIDLGGILWGSKTNGSNSTSDISTQLRRNLSDGVVWIAVLFALSKMWWFQKQQQQHQHGL